MALIRFLVVCLLAGAAANTSAGAATARPELVAQFGHQVSGVAVSEKNRTFLTFPRWTEDSAVSLAELLPDGTLRPYPDTRWNAWRSTRTHTLAPGAHWVSPQGVFADGHGKLWVLDPAAPAQGAIVPGGPKLVGIDLACDRVARVFRFGEEVAPQGSYLNDLRLSPDGRYAFLTDSGMRGAIVVVELSTGRARRVLDRHPSTQPKPGLVIHAGDRPLGRTDGRQVKAGADGIALSHDGRYLYWQALAGDTLYRVPTQVLETRGLAGEDVSGSVEQYGLNGVADGLWIAQGTDFMFIASVEDDTIWLRDLGAGADAPRQLWTREARLRWPDTFAQGPDGSIYVTTSRMQDSALFDKSAPRALPTQLWRLPRLRQGPQIIMRGGQPR